MMTKSRIKTCCPAVTFYILLTFIFPSPLFAGKLDDFEEEATKEQATRNEPLDDRSDENENNGRIYLGNEEDGCDSLIDCFLGLTVEVLYYGGKTSFDQRRYNESVKGTPILPSISLDTDYQNVQSDVYSINNRVEIGYGPFAFQYKEMRYFETDPDDRLRIHQFNYLHRMSDGASFRVDFGVGTVTIEGDGSSTGLSLLAPVYVFLPKKCSVYLRPNWGWINGNAIQDYKLGFLVGRKYISVQGGYRFVKSGQETLNGPFIGFNLHY